MLHFACSLNDCSLDSCSLRWLLLKRLLFRWLPVLTFNKSRAVIILLILKVKIDSYFVDFEKVTTIITTIIVTITIIITSNDANNNNNNDNDNTSNNSNNKINLVTTQVHNEIALQHRIPISWTFYKKLVLKRYLDTQICFWNEIAVQHKIPISWTFIKHGLLLWPLETNF